MEEKRCEHKHTMNAELRCKLPAGHMGGHLCAYEHMHNQDAAPADMTPDQRAEYQRLLVSPTATAMALIEARAEIERLRAKVEMHESFDGHRNYFDVWSRVWQALEDTGMLFYPSTDGLGKSRAIQHIQRMHTKASVAESQIAALKVELAAMMKERDTARSEATMYKQAYDGHFASLMDVCDQRDAAEDARDAALAELGQVRAEREIEKKNTDAVYDEVYRALTKVQGERDAAVKRAEALREENARLEYERNKLREYSDEYLRRCDVLSALLGRAVAALRKAPPLLEEGVSIADALTSAANGYHDLKARHGAEVSSALDTIDAILADTTATQAADAWRAQQKERAELLREAMHMLCYVDAHMKERVAVAEKLAKACGHPWPPYPNAHDDSDCDEDCEKCNPVDARRKGSE